MMIATVVGLIGRTLLAGLFILAGLTKILGPKPFLEHMSQHRIPGLLLPAVIALEIGAGLAVLLGWKLPWSAGALALFCVATALVFHSDFGDKAERTQFIKDLAIAGGLMLLATAQLRISGGAIG
jgi:putative oxidoreductase